MRIPLHPIVALAVFCAGVATSAFAAERFVLDRIGVSRFTALGADKLTRQQGTFQIDGRVVWGPSFEQARPANLSPLALDRILVRREDWLAYRNLGADATANFRLGEGAVVVVIGDAAYWVAEINPNAGFATGKVLGLSTRTRLAPGGGPVIAGFVIESRPRWVLIRGVGPGLTPLGVAGALPNPTITVLRGSTPIYVNDDWNTRFDAAALRNVTTSLGLFPLAEGSRDAALLVELTPGAYTVTLESAVPNVGGEILIEVYSVPEPETP